MEVYVLNIIYHLIIYSMMSSHECARNVYAQLCHSTLGLIQMLMVLRYEQFFSVHRVDLLETTRDALLSHQQGH
jgi:hypothetical protein